MIFIAVLLNDHLLSLRFLREKKTTKNFLIENVIFTVN